MAKYTRNIAGCEARGGGVGRGEARRALGGHGQRPGAKQCGNEVYINMKFKCLLISPSRFGYRTGVFYSASYVILLGGPAISRL